jgi:uncharacterized protein
MHFAEDRSDARFWVKSYTPGCLITTEARFETPIVFFADTAYPDLLPPTVAALTPAHFEALAAFAPHLLILGTGPTQIFPEPALFAPLMQRHIGFEIMHTDAAVMTYNLLITEGRKVLAAFFL